MNMMPISSYPMTSDDKSQIQVLGERKSELNQQAQEITESPMSESEKQRALNDIGEKTDSANREIMHKQVSLTAKKKEDNARVFKKQSDNTRIEKNAIAAQSTKKAAEKEQEIGAGSKKAHKELDFYA
jgi:hypothetical protein